jgi:hypothetical protein
MLQSIEEASQNFCIHQIRKPHEVIDGITKMRTLIAYIDIDAQDKKRYRVYIASNQGFMQRVSTVFLEEEESDEETLVDMTLETANLIVGSAKVIAEEKNENPYTIGTPVFLKLDIFDFAYDEAKTLKIEDDVISVAIKELNGEA